MEIPPAGEHRATVIWLHGLGADGHDFEPIIPLLRLPKSLGVRFIFPEAPFRPVTLNGGAVMRAWFDLVDIGACNEDQLDEAVDDLRALFALEEARGIPAERIALAGFSQGGSLALRAATGPGPNLEPPLEPAGVVALSTWLGDDEGIIPPLRRSVPIFQAHGLFDPMIEEARGARTRRALEGRGWEVEYRTYPMAHQVIREEAEDVGRFLRRVLTGAESPPGTEG